MLYLFHGTDVEKVRNKAFEWVAKARAKEPNLAYVRLAREELTDAVLEDVAQSGGLFVKRLLVLLDDPFPSSKAKSEDDENEDEPYSAEASKGTGGENIIDEHLDRLATSDNAIIILAPKLLASKAKKLATKAKVEYKYDSPPAREARGFNSNLVNALGAHSREKLWLEINRALMAGDAPEMLHGLLHWKARDLRDRRLSLALISLLQSSRRGGLDLSLSLERFALSI